MPPPPPNPTYWLKLADFIQFIWDNISTPTELGWTVLVLIQKGSTYTWGIGILEVMWKVVEAVIYTRIKTVVQFHDVLHGFRAGRGAGTTITELKLAQYLASVNQDPIFLVFFDLRMAYNNLERGRIIKFMAGYGAGPKLRGLLV